MEMCEDWLREIKEKNDEITVLKRDVNEIIKRYVTYKGLRTIHTNIEKMGFEIKTYYFDEDDGKYAFFVESNDPNNRALEKRKIVEAAFDGIDDEFVIRHVKISTAKRMKKYAEY